MKVIASSESTQPAVLAYRRPEARGGKSVSQIERDGCLFEYGRCAVLHDRHLAVRMRICGIERARSIAAADGDMLDVVRLPDLLEEPQKA
jgi:hypothetical protein